MVKALSILAAAFFVLLAGPLIIGLGGGLLGFIIGLVGGLFGLIVGLLGAAIGAIAWVFRSIFHIFFGWHTGLGHHHWFHVNGYVCAAIIILVLVIALNKKK
jgi:hypothetical protein